MHYAGNEVTIINELPRTYRKCRCECEGWRYFSLNGLPSLS